MEEGQADIDDVMARVARVDQLRAQARALEAQAAALLSGGALAPSQGRAASRVSSTNRQASFDSLRPGELGNPTSKSKTSQGGNEGYTEADVELEEASARVKVACVEGLLAGTAKTRTPSNTETFASSSLFAYFGKDKGTASTLLGVDDFPESTEASGSSDAAPEGSPWKISAIGFPRSASLPTSPILAVGCESHTVGGGVLPTDCFATRNSPIRPLAPSGQLHHPGLDFDPLDFGPAMSPLHAPLTLSREPGRTCTTEAVTLFRPRFPTDAPVQPSRYYHLDQDIEHRASDAVNKKLQDKVNTQDAYTHSH